MCLAEIWSDWSSWTDCPLECGVHYQNRTRTCFLNTSTGLCFDGDFEKKSCGNHCQTGKISDLSNQISAVAFLTAACTAL